MKKGARTLEDRTVAVDVVETYVPIMDMDRFIGAFEIYYDITDRNEALNDVALHSSLISFVLVFSFFLITTIILFKAEKENADFKVGRLPAMYRSPFYLLLAVMASIFVTEGLVMFILYVLSPRSRFIEGIIDSAMLVMMLSPFLYFFLLHPLTLHIKKRKHAEDELMKSYDELEIRIRERTAELTEKNRQLGVEISERKQMEIERERLIGELKDALAKVKTLRGLLPICSSCNKIRDERGNWAHVDVYISGHSDAEFTHGYCPECEKKHFPQKYKDEN